MHIRISASAVRLRLELIYASGRLCSTLSDATGRTIVSAETEFTRRAIEGLSGTASGRPDGEAFGALLLLGKQRDEVRRCLDGGQVVLALTGTEEVVNLPWEFAVVREVYEAPLALHPRMTLLRVEGSGASAWETRQRPTLLLAMANPGSARFPLLDFADAELESVMRALNAPECRGLYVEVMRYATPDGLRRAINDRPPSVLHFIGHAERRSTGVALALESGRQGVEAMLYVDELLTGLRMAQTQLVVLSACNSALAPGRFGSAFAREGMPAFIGMQRPLTDAGAQLLSRALYSSLAEGAAIDEALRQARLAVSGMAADWGAPVLVVNERLIKGDKSEQRDQEEAVKVAPSSLPAQLTLFVGRESEMALVKDVLKDHRLVSLVGPGGIGKTRLAIEAATQGAGDYADGVWFVGLENVRETTAVAPTFAHILGVRDLSGQSLVKAMADRLENMSTLIVVDNCEHVVAEAARIIQSLLASAPNLRVISTGRTSLGIRGERTVRIPPLPLPSPDAEDLQENAAIRLFADRALLANPRFEVCRRNAETLCRLIRRLDGIPLAIELAAARTGVMSLDRLVSRLEATFSDLKVSGRGRVPRQQTLEATMAWSFGLLNRKERTLFIRLGVFAGSWSLEAAEGIVGFSTMKREEVLQLLIRLVEHSLVTAEPMSHGEVRYRYLQVVRDAAQSRLKTSRDSPTLYAGFFSWLGDLAARIGDGIHGPDQLRCRQVFAEELDNFRAAISWGLSRPDEIANTARLLLRLSSPWMMHNGQADAQAYFDRLESSLPRDARGLRARVLGIRGRSRLRAGDLDGLQMLRAAVQMADGIDPAAFSWAVFNLGGMLIEIGELDEAEVTFKRAAQLEGQDPDTLRAYPLYFGILAAERGQYGEAERIYRKGLSDPEMARVPRDRGLFLGYLAVARDLQHEPDAAELYREGLSDLADVACYQSLACLLPAASAILLSTSPAAAAQIQGYSDRLLTETNVRLDPHIAARAERGRAATAGALGREYSRFYAGGRLLELESALALLGIETSPVRLSTDIRKPLPVVSRIRL